MKPAQDRLADDLQKLTFNNPQIPVVCNVDALVVQAADASRDALVRQVTGSVKWDQSVRLLIASGTQTMIEVGPGKVLWGLMRQIDRKPASLYVGDDASLQKTLEHLSQTPA
jgi:[acyl-carrier-protein] S-malonyltransferase